MSTVEEVEEALRRLSPDEQATFRHWYAEFDAEQWIGNSKPMSRRGRLDLLINEARQDKRDGRCTDR